MNSVTLILTLAILTGQLIKIPFFSGGVSLLDFSIIFLSFIGLYNLKFHLNKPPKFIKAGLAFILICIISEILTPLHLQINEYLNSLFYIVRFSFYILFTWLIYSNAFLNLKEKINNTLIYSGIGLSILGLLQFIFLPDLSFLTQFGFDPHYFRTVSTFLDPNFIGGYFVLTLILILSLRANEMVEAIYSLNRLLRPRLWRVLAITIVYLALLTTFSRSSYLMFLISGLTLSFLQKSKNLFIKVLILFLILLLGFQIYTQLISKPRHINREQSAAYRLGTWQQGWRLFQNHPILGIGFNSYKYALKEYKSGDEQFLSSHGSTTNDSSLLFVLSTTGIIGLSIYLYLLYSIANYSNNKKLTTAIITGLLVHSFFANSLFFPPILFWVLITSILPKK